MTTLNQRAKLFWLLLLSSLLLGCTVAERDVEAAAEQIVLPTVAAVPSATPPPLEVVAQPAIAREPVVETTFAQWVKDDSPAAGSESTLVRMPHGLYVTFKAVDLVPGDAYTMWWTIINKPENCSDSVCGLDDGFLMNDDGTIQMIDFEPQFNWLGRAATDFSVQRATGSIVDVDGTAEFRAHVAVGDMTEAMFGGEGLDDAFSAEIHVVLRTHGQAIPGQIHSQMNTPWGGCPEGWPKDPCRNVLFAVHRAAP